MKKLFYLLGLGLEVVAVVLSLPTCILAAIANVFFGWSYKEKKEEDNE